MPHSGWGVPGGGTVDSLYEALRAAVEFETLAAQTTDPHIKAVYLNLARRYRELGAKEIDVGRHLPRRNAANNS